MFSDANWGGTHTDRRSVGGGGCFMNGALVLWQCKRQPVITLSSAESEYTQASLMACMALYARSVATDIGIPQISATPLLEDNQSAINIASNPMASVRSRHVDIKYHHLKDEVRKGTIRMVFLPTANQLADIFTKSLGNILFVRFRDIIKGNQPFEDELLQACNARPQVTGNPITLIVFGTNWTST